MTAIFFPNSFKGYLQFRSFFFVYLIEYYFPQHLEIPNVRPTGFNFVAGPLQIVAPKPRLGWHLKYRVKN